MEFRVEVFLGSSLLFRGIVFATSKHRWLNGRCHRRRRPFPLLLLPSRSFSFCLISNDAAINCVLPLSGSAADSTLRSEEWRKQQPAEREGGREGGREEESKSNCPLEQWNNAPPQSPYFNVFFYQFQLGSNSNSSSRHLRAMGLELETPHAEWKSVAVTREGVKGATRDG